MNGQLISKLREYHEVQSTLNENLEKLDALKNDAELIKELEFEKKLMALLKRHSKTLEDLLGFIRNTGSANPFQSQTHLTIRGDQARQSRKKHSHGINR